MFNGSPSAIITLGLGTGAGFDGSVPLVLTLGLGAGEEVEPPVADIARFIPLRSAANLRVDARSAASLRVPLRTSQ